MRKNLSYEAETLHAVRMIELIDYTRNQSDTEPYGCAIYNSIGTKLASSVGNKKSPINHAEILCINDVASKVQDYDWNLLTLYSTGEPCTMCASACCWANIGTVVYATNIPFMLSLWGIESSVRAADVIQSHPKKPNLIAGVCENEANELFLKRKEEFLTACKNHRWV